MNCNIECENEDLFLLIYLKRNLCASNKAFILCTPWDYLAVFISLCVMLNIFEPFSQLPGLLSASLPFLVTDSSLEGVLTECRKVDKALIFWHYLKSVYAYRFMWQTNITIYEMREMTIFIQKNLHES